MHTHHSHSGQYVQHAKDTLDEVVADALSKQFDVFCLTEHMPRYDSGDLYPEEIASNTTPADLILVFENYYIHAKRVQAEINAKRSAQKERLKAGGDKEKRIPQILVGFECEGLSDRYLDHVENIQKDHEFDLIVGSVHHVHDIPIDYDEEQWAKAAEISLSNHQSFANPDEPRDFTAARALFHDYLDLQYRLLTKITPSVIGHFDLIRLFTPKSIAEAASSPEFLATKWPDVWQKVVRNVEYAVGYGALFEMNSAAVRKGWPTPYPASDVAKLIVEKGGRFCLSDDSHGTAQVGLNYHKSLQYLQDLKVEKLYYLSLPEQDDVDNGTVPIFLKDRPIVKSIPLADVRRDIFWEQYNP